MDETQNKIVKDVFFGLRQIEREIGKLIKKLTAVDKMSKGEYRPNHATAKPEATTNTAPTPANIGPQNTGQ